ncbi:hypothetical protein D0T49_06440 [Paludibacter sp. 221]|uniref:DUF6452 family protein n=1 Tax=Paludibacter sp. 221 TaxID=2302939 RepID=UPI0013D1C873|nr:DUF6452 family protein [Paludibacter sp. 221]NDV46682.1 hypothetical protein [Paludibacter sp. 221]
MSKNLVRVLFFTVSFCTLFLFSCGNDEECRRDKFVRLYAGFYTVKTDTITGISAESKLSVDSITVKGVGVDSLLYNNSKKLNSVQLQLNKLKTQSDFVFVFNNVVDTIKFGYSSSESYLSFECGTLTTFALDTLNSKHTTNYIDSIIIISPEVSTADVENIKIYHTPK